MTTPPAIIRFEAFTLDLANRQLRCDGKQVELGSRYFDALALLVAEAGSLVSKDRFMNDVWRGIPVTDEALTQCIRTLRKALGDDAGAPRFIQTVPKHGYRFLAAIGPEPGVVKEQASTPGHELAPSRVAGACTLAGAAAGSLGGLIYFLLAGAGGGPGLLALGAMVGALGMLAGAGIGLALGGALALRRKADFWLVPAGAAGGMMTGALGSTLAREGIVLLTGSAIGPVTGLFEGIVLGLAAGMAALLVGAARPHHPKAGRSGDDRGRSGDYTSRAWRQFARRQPVGIAAGAGHIAICSRRRWRDTGGGEFRSPSASADGNGRRRCFHRLVGWRSAVRFAQATGCQIKSGPPAKEDRLFFVNISAGYAQPADLPARWKCARSRPNCRGSR